MLIGQNSAHLIVSRETRELSGDPTILSRAALGWSAHGGILHNCAPAYTLCLRREKDESLNKLVRGNFAVDSLGITSTHHNLIPEQRAVI